MPDLSLADYSRRALHSRDALKHVIYDVYLSRAQRTIRPSMCHSAAVEKTLILFCAWPQRLVASFDEICASAGGLPP